jgi:hypothetical protein
MAFGKGGKVKTD